MPRKRVSPAIGLSVRSRPKLRLFSRATTVSAAVSLCIFAAGCSLRPITKPAAAFSSAACLVVDNSALAYRAAIDLHDQEQASAGVLSFEEGRPWDPHDIQPLIGPEGLEARLHVLAALKTYAQSLSDLTSGLDSPALDAAAASAGSNLQSLGAAFNTTPAGAALALPVGTQTANGASTAARALGEYLTARKVKGSLSSVTRTMDPNISALCQLLTDDIATLRTQSKKDYEDLLRQQTVFVRENMKQFTPSERREQIGRLPSILRNEQSTDAMLGELQEAIARLALTHHALAAAAQDKHPEALRARIDDLAAAGQNLGQYYQGLPTK